MDFIKKILIIILSFSSLFAMQMEIDQKYTITCNDDQQLGLDQNQYDLLVSCCNTIKHLTDDAQATDNELCLPIDKASLDSVSKALPIANEVQDKLIMFKKLHAYFSSLSLPELISFIETDNLSTSILQKNTFQIF